MESINSNSVSGKFALWGPRGSGKDWVIKSFARSLEQYNIDNNNNNRYDKDFEHLVFHGDSITPVKIQAPGHIDATVQGAPDDTVYIYERRGRKSSPVHAVSAHVHEILITNASGEDLVKADVHSVNYAVQKATCLLILLDPTIINAGITTMAEYQSWVADLLENLEKPSNGDKRYIAACITKIDMLKTKRPDPTEDLNMYFGPGMDEVFRTHTKSKDVEYKLFSISSYGFLKDGKTPNYSNETEHLMDSNYWNPINVEQPFFWLFEKVERHRLERFSSNLSKFIYLDERKKKYRGFPQGR